MLEATTITRCAVSPGKLLNAHASSTGGMVSAITGPPPQDCEEKVSTRRAAETGSDAWRDQSRVLPHIPRGMSPTISPSRPPGMRDATTCARQPGSLGDVWGDLASCTAAEARCDPHHAPPGFSGETLDRPRSIRCARCLARSPARRRRLLEEGLDSPRCAALAWMFEATARARRLTSPGEGSDQPLDVHRRGRSMRPTEFASAYSRGISRSISPRTRRDQPRASARLPRGES